MPGFLPVSRKSTWSVFLARTLFARTVCAKVRLRQKSPAPAKKTRLRLHKSQHCSWTSTTSLLPCFPQRDCRKIVCLHLPPKFVLKRKKNKIVNFYAAARNIFYEVRILTPFWPVLWIRIRNFFLDPELFVLDQDPATLKEQLNKKKYF